MSFYDEPPEHYEEYEEEFYIREIDKHIKELDNIMYNCSDKVLKYYIEQIFTLYKELITLYLK